MGFGSIVADADRAGKIDVGGTWPGLLSTRPGRERPRTEIQRRIQFRSAQNSSRSARLASRRFVDAISGSDISIGAGARAAESGERRVARWFHCQTESASHPVNRPRSD